jgi:sulfite dehydrogenase (quinone) subunit SoeC
MRPTFSIIFFTVMSGAGYGVWFLLGLGLALHWPTCGVPGPRDADGVSLRLCVYPQLIDYLFAAGFILVTAGLLSSLGHLGKPRRAWRALSQWRSSWLSREGVAAILTYVPAIGVIAIPLMIAWQTRDLSLGDPVELWFDHGALRAVGTALTLGCLTTVWCTAHIYSSLKPVRAWHNAFVVPAYLALALDAGLLWLSALSSLPDVSAASARALETKATLIALAITSAVCALLKHFYWRNIERAPQASPGRATGLDAIGSVHVFEAPHTEENYLTHEMGFVLARKHARKLRAITLVCAFAVPGLLALLALALPSIRVPASWLALLVGMTGIFVERWLFFAEARHTVMAFYGR